MFRKQPKIEVKPTITDLKIIRLGWFLVILNFIIVGIFYVDLPEEIPIHFNFKGEADGFGSKTNIWFLPLLTLIMYYGMNLVILKVKPWQMNYPVSVTEKNAPQLYAMNLRMLVLVNLAISLVLFPTSIEIIVAGKYGDTGFNFTIITIIICLIFTLLPFYFIFKMFKFSKL